MYINALSSNPFGECAGGSVPNFGSWSVSGANNALEYVFRQTALNRKTAVVNMSINSSVDFRDNTLVSNAMKNVATPKWIYYGGQPGFYYPGSLIVQSAGNKKQLACNWAFTTPSGIPNPNDGIIVVGGINNSGQEVNLANGGYVNVFDSGSPASIAPGSVIGTSPEDGSNDGSCVEMHAPSQTIYSAWRSSSYRFLSGTSMAAPHVAGFAARLLEQNPTAAWTAPSLEQAVRAKLKSLGGGISIPQF
jgi:subtilisin family serine protease